MICLAVIWEEGILFSLVALCSLHVAFNDFFVLISIFQVRSFRHIFVMLGSLLIYCQIKELIGNSESMNGMVD